MYNKFLNHIIFILFLSFCIISFNKVQVNADTGNIDNIPNPPENGPSVNGNYSVNGSTIKQLYDKFDNIQVVSDGQSSNAQSMWWKNKINVMRPFTIKFYAYISPTKLALDHLQNDYTSDPPADGITFTLQNDSKTAIGSSGQSLGVYGNNTNSNNQSGDTSQYYGGSYIQNAFSYEFDPYTNADGSDTGITNFKTGNPISHSPGIIGEHLAFTTTDSSGISYQTDHFAQNHYSTLPLFYFYQLQKNNLNDTSPYFLKNYNNWLNGFGHQNGFSTGWHKFVYSWTPNDDKTQGTASVSVDDDNKMGLEQSHTINIQQILNANSDNPYVWWGFTGSTGNRSMIAAIADTEVTGDPGITKLVLNLSNLSQIDKDKINNKIDSSNYNDETKLQLKTCVNNPSDSSSDSDLSNKLVSIINSVDKSLFHAVIGSNKTDSNNSKIGDVLLYKVDIYNYTVPDKKGNSLGNNWNNVVVRDNDLSRIGMKSLDNQDNINAKYNTIPATDITSNDSDKQPSSVGLRTVITSNNGGNLRSNTVTANGDNFLNDGNNNTVKNDDGNVHRSSRADVYVNNSSNNIPRIVANNNITDVTQNQSSEDNTLNNVSKNDEINYDINLNNIVENSQTSSGSSYSFWVPSLKSVNSIKVNGNAIGNADNSELHYLISDGYNERDKIDSSYNKNLNGNNKKLITIYNINSISHNSPVKITADVKLDKQNPTNFSSYPIFNDYGNNRYYIQKPEIYNFNPGSLGFKYIRSIDYGLNAGYLINGYISPYHLYDDKDTSNNGYLNNKNGNYNIAQIFDSRTIKTPYNVWLSQVEEHPNDNTIGSVHSPFVLKYFDNNDSYDISPIKNISSKSKSNSAVVYHSDINDDNDNDINSDISWNEDKALKLGSNHNFSSKIPGGKYNADLNWTFDNAPS